MKNASYSLYFVIKGNLIPTLYVHQGRLSLCAPAEYSFRMFQHRKCFLKVFYDPCFFFYQDGKNAYINQVVNVNFT